MKTFRVNKKAQVICETKNTRNGFKHEATLLVDGQEYGFAKICYLNRTWESYNYESVLEKLIGENEYLTKRQKNHFLKKTKQKETGRFNDTLKTVKMAAAFGEVLCEDQKSKNDWKKRMLKAGVPGVSFPDDWDKLSEEEKQKRLDQAVNV